ncbi:MAG: hypothetical protein ACKOX3_06245 [Bacteroidota bacterium]
MLCFFIATAIWTINALNKEHKAKVVFTANINVPFSKTSESGKQEIKTTVYLKGRGFDLAKFLFFLNKKDRVINCTSNNSDKIDLRAAIVDCIKSQNNAITVEEVTPSFYALQSKMTYSKKVGIVIDYQLTIPSLYMQGDKPICSPDSLLISSEFPIPDSIKNVNMEMESFKSEGASVEKVIAFKKLKNIFIEPTPVTLTIPIEAATEKIIKVPVTCAQSNRQLKFIPSEISITCKVPISKFDKTTASSFTANARFNNNGKSKAVIEITKKPEWTDQVRWSPASVDYFHQNP